MDVVTVPSRSGSMVVDFDAKTIKLNRQGFLAKGAGLTDMTIRFEDITHIELSRPTFSKLGICCFILNGTRYVVPNGGMDATNFNVANGDFPLLESTLGRLMNVCGIAGYTEPNSIDFPTIVYSNGIVSGATQNNAGAGVQQPAATDSAANNSGMNQSIANGATTPSVSASGGGGCLYLVGVLLIIVSVIMDVVSMIMINTSSFEGFNTVLVVGTVLFFVGLALTFFGKVSK